MYAAWVDILRDQPPPRHADKFLPNIKRIFSAAGVPEELAWLPEVESTFNPRAYNPSGARGLFQFMPGTAREHGLKLQPLDERIDPEKSARAAASLLRHLHETFESWPLALAAYNAGEGCVRRALQAGDATTFAEIADRLPNETRLYVPRVLATLAVREGVTPAELNARTHAEL
jgi:membrane-bound lytic murein transglycosylase D